MNLTPNFTLEELTASQTAVREGIDNDPPPEIVITLQRTAAGMEAVRTLLWGKPILISSGYRSPELNARVKGQPHSQHLTGEAVDFTCPQYGDVDTIVRAIIGSAIDFDQVISEYGGRWCHISFSDRSRRQALVIDADGTRAFA